MRAFLAFFVLQHAAASGACCASAPSAKLALRGPSPFKARGARPSRGRRREPYRAHRAPRVPRERCIDLACASSPLRAHRRACTAVMACCKGALGGGCGGSCLARRTNKVGLDKMDKRQARVRAGKHGQHDLTKFGAVILEFTRDPESGLSDSRALLSRRTMARR
ncbi:hypothetical protein T492DRAFT_839664 [Pavlovales sp. CCMP2436]|nr:hypothetical protein T492DRAFT_839664 [Pavlovales sp. CCMP2436]